VAAAKRQVRGRVEIDGEAGPSEVVVLADDSADPGWVAVDLLAQAEHGSGDETAVLVTPSAELAEEAARLVQEGLAAAANRARTRRALARFGAVVRVRDLEEGLAAVNALAPEHAEVMTRSAASLARRVVAGRCSWVPGHPCGGGLRRRPQPRVAHRGAARFSSPLSVRDFQRRSSRVQLSEAGLRRVAADVARVAQAEGFTAHAQSVLTRFAHEAPVARRRR